MFYGELVVTQILLFQEARLKEYKCQHWWKGSRVLIQDKQQSFEHKKTVKKNNAQRSPSRQINCSKDESLCMSLILLIFVNLFYLLFFGHCASICLCFCVLCSLFYIKTRITSSSWFNTEPFMVIITVTLNI